MAATAANSWHREIRTWNQRNEFLFKNEIMSDCKFIVTEDGGNKTIIPAHKYVLGGNSAEFYNMFYLMESSDEISIEDTTADNLTKFLEFLYTEKTNLTMENVGDLLKLAKRYSVNHFEEFCGQFLSEKVNEANALSIMDTYSDYEMPTLFSECIKLINRNQLIFESTAFLNVNIQTITELLKSADLEGFQEITIFNGVNKWAENFCLENNQIVSSENKRSAVGPALELIRFAAMDLKDFTSCTLNNSFLTSAEIFQIHKSIGTKGESNCIFPSEKRRSEIKILKFEFPKLYDSYDFNFTDAEKYNLLKITSSRQIYFYGFGLFGRTDDNLYEQNPESYTIKLKDDTQCILMESVVKIHHDGTDKTYDFCFDDSILLKPGVTYTASFNRQIPRCFFNYCGPIDVDFQADVDGIMLKLSNNGLFKSIMFSV